MQFFVKLQRTVCASELHGSHKCSSTRQPSTVNIVKRDNKQSVFSRIPQKLDCKQSCDYFDRTFGRFSTGWWMHLVLFHGLTKVINVHGQRHAKPKDKLDMLIYYYIADWNPDLMSLYITKSSV